jgi:hypothetical protein
MGREEDKKEDKKIEEIPWTPDKPLADEEDEAECQRRARAEARKAHLIGTFSKEPEKVKKKEDGKRRPLWG